MAFQAARAELLLQTLLRLCAQTQLALDGVLVFFVGFSAGESGEKGKLGVGSIVGEFSRGLAAFDFGGDAGVKYQNEKRTLRDTERLPENCISS